MDLAKGKNRMGSMSFLQLKLVGLQDLDFNSVDKELGSAHFLWISQNYNWH
jgi:hypothetical protein